MVLCCHTHLNTSVSRSWSDSVSGGCDNRRTCVHPWVRRGSTGRVWSQKSHLWCHTLFLCSHTRHSYRIPVHYMHTSARTRKVCLLWINKACNKARAKDKDTVYKVWGDLRQSLGRVVYHESIKRVLKIWLWPIRRSLLWIDKARAKEKR